MEPHPPSTHRSSFINTSGRNGVELQPVDISDQTKHKTRSTLISNEDLDTKNDKARGPLRTHTPYRLPVRAAEPITSATSSEGPLREPGGDLVEVEPVYSQLFLTAVEEEPDGDACVKWDQIQRRIIKILEASCLSYQILVLKFELAVKLQTYKLPPFNFMNTISASSHNNKGARGSWFPRVHLIGGKRFISRGWLKPTILFLGLSKDHPKFKSFIDSQKWLENYGFNMEVLEGSYHYSGILEADQLASGPAVFVGSRWNQLCGIAGTLETNVKTTTSTPYHTSRFTIGGILVIDGNLFGMTVGHILDSKLHASVVGHDLGNEAIEKWLPIPDTRIGHIVHSSWSKDTTTSRPNTSRRETVPNCDWSVIELNNSQAWVVNQFPNYNTDHGHEQQPSRQMITRFAGEEDISNRELSEGEALILTGYSGSVPGRLKVTPVLLHLRGILSVAREIVIKSPLSEFSCSKTARACHEDLLVQS